MDSEERRPGEGEPGGGGWTDSALGGRGDRKKERERKREKGREEKGEEDVKREDDVTKNCREKKMHDDGSTVDPQPRPR